MTLFSIAPSDRQWQLLLNLLGRAVDASLLQQQAVLAKIEAAKQELLTELRKHNADSELANAARAAAPVINETVAALDQFTPNK